MPRKKAKLLIVDDEKDICQFLNQLFKKEKFLVYNAASKKEAISLVEEIRPDIVLLDVYLKGTAGGFEVLKYIKNLTPKAKVIVVTGFGDEEAEEKCSSFGADLFIKKPVSVPELIAAVVKLRKR